MTADFRAFQKATAVTDRRDSVIQRSQIVNQGTLPAPAARRRWGGFAAKSMPKKRCKTSPHLSLTLSPPIQWERRGNKLSARTECMRYRNQDTPGRRCRVGFVFRAAGKFAPCFGPVLKGKLGLAFGFVS